MIRRLIAVLALLLAFSSAGSVARADRLVKGNSVVWIGLLGNKAQLIGPDTGPANIYEADEIGAHVALSHFVCDKWAAVLSGSFGFGKESFAPTVGTDQKETSKSFAGRFGFDRYAFINDDVALYAGPGLTYWTGRAKYQGSGSPAVDGDWPKGTHYGLFGHIGQVLATNSADGAPGKNTWWTMHHEEECRAGAGLLDRLWLDPQRRSNPGGRR